MNIIMNRYTWMSILGLTGYGMIINHQPAITSTLSTVSNYMKPETVQTITNTTQTAANVLLKIPDELGDGLKTGVREIIRPIVKETVQITAESFLEVFWGFIDGVWQGAQERMNAAISDPGLLRLRVFGSPPPHALGPVEWTIDIIRNSPMQSMAVTGLLLTGGVAYYKRDAIKEGMQKAQAAWNQYWNPPAPSKPEVKTTQAPEGQSSKSKTSETPATKTEASQTKPTKQTHPPVPRPVKVAKAVPNPTATVETKVETKK